MIDGGKGIKVGQKSPSLMAILEVDDSSRIVSNEARFDVVV